MGSSLGGFRSIERFGREKGYALASLCLLTAVRAEVEDERR